MSTNNIKEAEGLPKIPQECQAYIPEGTKREDYKSFMTGKQECKEVLPYYGGLGFVPFLGTGLAIVGCLSVAAGVLMVFAVKENRDKILNPLTNLGGKLQKATGELTQKNSWPEASTESVSAENQVVEINASEVQDKPVAEVSSVPDSKTTITDKVVSPEYTLGRFWGRLDCEYDIYAAIEVLLERVRSNPRVRGAEQDSLVKEIKQLSSFDSPVSFDLSVAIGMNTPVVSKATRILAEMDRGFSNPSTDKSEAVAPADNGKTETPVAPVTEDTEEIDLGDVEEVIPF